MALRVDVYKHRGTSCSNGGLSSRHDEATVVGTLQLDGTFAEQPGPACDPHADAPAVIVVEREIGGKRADYAVPVLPDGEGWQRFQPQGSVGPMMGGCFLWSGDSRFPRPVPLHDRFETTSQYASHD